MDPPVAEPPSRAEAFARRAASAVHAALIVFGSLIFMHSMHTLVFFQQQGQWASLREMARTAGQSYLLVLKFFLAPFLEAGFLDAWLPSEVDFDTWAVFVPGIMSLFICLTAFLGMSVMRRPGPYAALGYAVLAAVLLVSQVELTQALAELSTWEEVPLQKGSADAKLDMQLQLFKASHSHFISMLDEQQCPLESADIVRCTLEKRVLPIFVVQELCRPMDLAGQSSKQRLEACQKAGSALSLWKSPTESDELYCRCWSATFDAMQSMLEWAMLLWFTCLLAVLLAVYTSIWPKLRSMGQQAHKEVLGCAGLGTLAIIWKVVMFVEESRS